MNVIHGGALPFNGDPHLSITQFTFEQAVDVWMRHFSGQYQQLPHLIQATALMAMAVPVLIFILAQKVFVQGVVVTGVDK